MKIKPVLQLLVAFSVSIITAQAQSINQVNSTDVDLMLKKEKNLVVLDVRTPQEFADGHIKGAVNIDVHQPDALNRINKLDKKAKYIVYCRTKNRSGAVSNNMINNGFKNVYQMMDGFTGWSLKGLPVAK